MLVVSMVAALLVGAPAGFGSADGRESAKTPLRRKARGTGDKKAVERAPEEQPKPTVIIGDLEVEEGATLPPKAAYAEAIDALLSTATKTVASRREGCVDLACLRALAAETGCSQLVQASFAADGRITLLLSELPGRGLLRKRVTMPVEAADQFRKELTDAMRDLLDIGGAGEGALGPDPVAATVVGESAEAMAARHRMLQHSTWGVYGGAGLAGAGLVVGLIATINASQWRNTSFRHEDGAYREQVRGIAAGRALLADILLASGTITAGASYYLQRRAAAGPGGRLSLGWGRAAEDAPAPPAAAEASGAGAEEASP